MTDEVQRILMKECYTIQDVAKIVGKTTATVRSWEVKKITPKHKGKSENGWKMYTRRDLEELLNALLNYKWERTVIKNEQDLEFIIRYCRGFIKLKDYPYKIESTDITKETNIPNYDIEFIYI